MHVKNLITAIGLVALLTLTGAGCSTSNKAGSDNDGGTSIKVTEESDNSAMLESYIKKTFGDSTITSFLNDFPVKGATGVEYKITRAAQQKDITTLENMLKKNGFKAESGPDDEGGFAVAGEKKDLLIIFSLKVGTAKVGALIMPVSEDEE